MSGVPGLEPEEGGLCRLTPYTDARGEHGLYLERRVPKTLLYEDDEQREVRVEAWVRDTGELITVECLVDGARGWAELFRLALLPAACRTYMPGEPGAMSDEELRDIVEQRLVVEDGVEPDAARERARELLDDSKPLWAVCWTTQIADEDFDMEDVWLESVDFDYTGPDAQALLRAALRAEAGMRGWRFIAEKELRMNKNNEGE